MASAGILNSSTVFFHLLLLCASPLCLAASAKHNITAILAGNPELSEFSAALNSYNLTAEIDNRATITVLAVDNAVMAQIPSLNLPADAVVHALEMHVLLDYFDAAKLHGLAAGSALAASLFQASGQAKESAGIVNISGRTSGRVAFTPYGTPESSPAVYYQKSIQESPYDIAVLQVSGVIPIPTVEAQPPAPVTSPASAPVTEPSASPAPTPTPVISPAPAPATTPSASPTPTPAPVTSPAPSPATEPSTFPAPVSSPAPAPDTEDNQPPADNGVSGGMASWGVLSAAAAVQAVALVLWC
uniref:FAS1 domain-containing protein n=1 Tax=Leersia perrieri TaxID=77586 RepID=A0A0D9WPA8_9ORYZ